MTMRQAAWFLAAYIAIVAVAIWFDVAILCQADAKYEQGCGGIGIYIPLWLAFLAPLPIAAIILERWKSAGPPPTARLIGYLVVILAVAELGFLFIDEFPVLLAFEAVIIATFWLGRSSAIRRASVADQAPPS